MGKASEIWKEIKPKIGEMLAAVNDIETRAEKAQDEAYQRGYCDALEKHCAICEEKHDAEEAYQQGLNDAWDAARKIASDNAGQNYSIFGQHFTAEILNTHSASEAIEKIRQYERGKEEQIQVGDEVISPNGKGVVTEIKDIYVRIMYAKGSGQVVKPEDLTKTGRHFPEIAEVLAKMREE